MKALLVKPDGTAELINSEWDYSEINKIIGGWIEAVYFGDKPYFAYIHEEGKILGMPENCNATNLWYDSGQRVLIGDFLAGNVLFFGLVDSDGNNTEVPEQAIEDIVRYGAELINYNN